VGKCRVLSLSLLDRQGGLLHKKMRTKSLSLSLPPPLPPLSPPPSLSLSH
jgi:hypothetical protein